MMRNASANAKKLSASSYNSTPSSSPRPHIRHAPHQNLIARSLQSLALKTADSELILLIIATKFLLSRLAPTIIDVLEVYYGRREFMGNEWLIAIVYASNLMVVLSSACNIVIFYAFSPTFRHSL